MIKSKISVFVLSTLLFHPTYLLAQQNIDREHGFSGDAFFGVGVVDSNGFLSTVNEDPIEDLQGDSPSGSETIPFVIGRITYTFEDTDQEAFLGISRQKAVRGSFAPEIGYRYHTGKHKFLEIAVLPGVQPSKVWEDPYLTGERRRETDANLTAVRARAQHILGPISLEAAYGTSEIDQERSGFFEDLLPDERASLDRNSTIRYVGVDLTIPLGEGFILIPSLFNFRTDADGDAMSFDTYGGELGVVYRSGRHTLVGNFGYEQLDYDTENPLFASPREDNISNIFAIYSFAEPFGFEDTSLTFILSNNSRVSDISFYEEESLVVGGGIRFIF
ncbi:DUF2860 family protein [uncultured Umboniibacter sp.]|uniref:DUF2860 family protein n=1 Tax=uncultured Umboniibacter sp. TaxID=1798917 RepID=UPI002626D2D4|nr:DUF2860 family protein [uncultured Umboniibacter sp.]